MQFFVLMVQRRGDVEVTHHVTSGLAGRLVASLFQQVLLQVGLQGQHAFDPLVAGGQHLERCLQASRRRAVAGQ